MKYYNDDLLCVIIICRDIYDIIVFSTAIGLAFGSSRACRDVYISEGRWRRRRGVVLHTLLLLYIYPSRAGVGRAHKKQTHSDEAAAAASVAADTRRVMTRRPVDPKESGSGARAC